MAEAGQPVSWAIRIYSLLDNASHVKCNNINKWNIIRVIVLPCYKLTKLSHVTEKVKRGRLPCLKWWTHWCVLRYANQYFTWQGFNSITIGMYPIYRHGTCDLWQRMLCNEVRCWFLCNYVEPWMLQAKSSPLVRHNMMTSSNGKSFRVTGPLCGEFTGHRWCFLSAPWINSWVNNREAGELRRHHAHYDVIVMLCHILSWVGEMESPYRIVTYIDYFHLILVT